MVREEDKESLWAMAHHHEYKQVRKIDVKLRARYLLLLGNQGAGKTTLLNRFLDRRDDLHKKKTLTLDFTFGRRTGKSLKKDVAHIWELGGGTRWLPATEAILSSSADQFRLSNLTIILMLDLSKPSRLWSTIKTTLDFLLKTISHQKSLDPDFYKDLEREAWNRIAVQETSDKEFLEPFPVPLVFLGGKYDLFDKFSPELKKNVCILLRCLAHTFGATLQVYSSHDATLIKRMKELFSHHGLGLRIGCNISQDHNKPIIIPGGTDAFLNMNMDFTIPPIPSSGWHSYHRWQDIFNKRIPQDPEVLSAVPYNPADDSNFKEFKVDSRRSFTSYSTE